MTSSTARRSRWTVRVLTFFALANLTACVSPQRPPDVVVFASGADLESPDPLVTTHPLSRQVQRYALLVTLLRYDSTLTPQPYFARRWSWSNDGKDLTLLLAPDLRWHDGAPTTARDAAFTFLAARDPTTGFARASELASLDTAIAVDDTTLLFRFRGAPAVLPALLCELPLVPAHLLAGTPRAALRSAAFDRTPVGNGPFRFEGRERGSSWSFVRNDSFPPSLGGPPSLRGFVVAIVDEATTKYAGLVSGELDVAGIAPTMATVAERDDLLRVVTYPVLFGTGLFFNTTRPPFDDVRVRRAVARSVNRRRIVDVALAGFGEPASSPVPGGSPLAWRAAPGVDTVIADRLLDAAGWRRGADGVRRRGGRPLEIDLLTVGSGDNVAEQLVQSDLAARGIIMHIRQTELGTFLTTARAPDKRFDVLLAGVPGDLALSQVNALFATSQRGGSLDYTGFHSPALDQALASATEARTDSARRASWIRVQVMLDSLAPATWLYHSRGVQGVTRRLQGLRMDLRGELVTLHDWSLAERRGAR
ncbi:MAG TPA: peptide ABC transporter substrate-binding protein [Gemmatimonadaceae bacterium]